MTTVRIPVGRPVFVFSTLIEWAPIRADVAALAAAPGTTILQRITIWQSRGLLVEVRTTNTLTDNVGSGAGPELSDEWESSRRAITLSAPGVSDLVIPGPALADVSDTTEPYDWRPFQDVSWLRAYNNLTNEQRNLTVALLDDGAGRVEYNGEPVYGAYYQGRRHRGIALGRSGIIWFQTAEPPNPPERLTVATRESDRLGFEFSPPSSGVTPQGYEYRYREGSGAWGDWSRDGIIPIGDRFRVVISGLTRNTEYTLEVRGYNVDQAGAAASATGRTLDEAPNASIESVTISPVPRVREDGTVEFTVTVEGNFDGDPVVVWSVAGHGNIGASTGRYSAGDAPGAEPIDATVTAAVSVTGTGTNAKSGTTAEASATQSFHVIPLPPTVLLATSRDEAVILDWSNPTDPIWAGVDIRWDVQRKLTSEGASGWRQVRQVQGNTYRVTGLVNGVSYDFRVRASDSGDPSRPDSGWSGTVSATPEELEIGLVSNLRLDRTYITGSDRAELVVDWGAPTTGAVPDGYEVRRRPGQIGDGGGGWTTPVEASNFADTLHRYVSLPRNTDFVIGVRATVEDETGNWSYINVRTADAPVASISSLAIDSITAVPEAGSHQFTATLDGVFDERDLAWAVESGVGSIDPDTGDYDTGDIGPGTTFAVVVKVTATVRGTGPIARVNTQATMEATVAFSVTPFPSPSLAATAGNGYVDLAIGAPPDAWADIPVRYDVQYKLSSASNWTQAAQIVTRTYRVTGLSNGSEYDFRVRAVDPAGEPVTPDSPWSGTVSATPIGPLGVSLEGATSVELPGFPGTQTGRFYDATVTNAVGDVTYDWDGGRATQSRSRRQYIWTATGRYRVSVDVEDDAGRTASASLRVTVTDEIPPLSVSISGPSDRVAGDGGTYVATVTGSAGGTLDYDWSGASSVNRQRATYIWTRPGTYTVEVDVSNDLGQEGSDSMRVSVSARRYNVEITGQTLINLPASGQTGRTYSASVSNHAGARLSYDWNGGRSGIANRFYVFTARGRYTVSVTVTGSTGSGSDSITVTVQ